MIFYTSDLHLGDQIIFDKCRRPFENLKEMEKTILANWNAKVGDEDVVYVLSDIMSSDSSSIGAFRNLKGHKRLIVGNHDHAVLSAIKDSGIFESVGFIDVIEDGGRKVCLCHYPLMDWIEFNRGGCLIYGHVHNKTEANGPAYKQMKEYFSDKPAFNCGVDVNGFAPMTLGEMIKSKEEGKHDPYIH